MTWSVGPYEGCYHLSRGAGGGYRQDIRFTMPTIDQGKALHRMGRIAEAEAVYRSVLARDPRQFDALHLLGLIRYQQGRAGEAHELLSQAIKLRPRSPQALAILIAALLALGRLEEALAACDRLIALDPRDLDALYNRAVVLSRLRRFDDALLAFEKVLARDGGSVDALFERGNMLAALSRFDEAAACYEAVLKKAPAHLGALTNRGNALARLGAHADALACYEELLTARPGDVNALSNRGIALKDLGRYEEAMASCERALNIDPNSVAALITRGNVLAKLSRYEEALASFERAAAVDPRDVDALNNRGFALTQLRRFGDAFASFDRALAIDPANIGVLDNRGAALLAINRFEDALATFDRALALKPDDAETLYHRAHALANLGRYEEAVSAWERVLAIDPGHPHALGALAFYRLMLCDWSRAEEFEARLKRALEDERAVVEPFTLLAYPIGPADQLRHTRRFVRHRLAAVPRLAQAHKARVGEKIRLAYLSADFRNHATAWLAAELFELHDRSRFEVLGVSYGVDDGSETRRRLVAAFDQFHDVALRSDREAAELLLDLDVDIAVDLKGHTEHGRPAMPPGAGAGELPRLSRDNGGGFHRLRIGGPDRSAARSTAVVQRDDRPPAKLLSSKAAYCGCSGRARQQRATSATRRAPAASIPHVSCSRQKRRYPSIWRATAWPTSSSTIFRSMRIPRRATRFGSGCRCSRAWERVSSAAWLRACSMPLAFPNSSPAVSTNTKLWL